MFNNRKLNVLEDRIKVLENIKDYEVVYLRRDLGKLQDLVTALSEYLQLEVQLNPKITMVEKSG